MTEYRQILVDSFDKFMGFAVNLSKDRYMANDIVQEAYARLLEKEGVYATKDLVAISMKAIRNIYINEYNFNKRFDGEVYERINPVNVIDIIGYKHVLSEIEGLIEPLRTPFKMYIAGYSYDEIANDLSVPLGTVKTYIYKARRELKSKMNRYG